MGTTNLRMSYGKCLSTPMLWGSMFGIVAISKGFHNMVIGSGQQPATMCAEFKAAETKRMMAKPCQAAEGKAMMQNPVSACHLITIPVVLVSTFFRRVSQSTLF